MVEKMVDMKRGWKKKKRGLGSIRMPTGPSQHEETRNSRKEFRYGKETKRSEVVFRIKKTHFSLKFYYFSKFL